MPETDTPLHEQENRRIVEPGYSRASVGGASRAAGEMDVAAPQASAKASTAKRKSSATKAGSARMPDGGKGNKRGPQTSGRAPSKRGKVAAPESGEIHAQEVVAVVADSELPLPLTLNADRELKDTAEDPLRYLMLTNVVSSPSLKANGTPWRGVVKFQTFYSRLLSRCARNQATLLQICQRPSVHHTGLAWRAADTSSASNLTRRFLLRC